MTTRASLLCCALAACAGEVPPDPTGSSELASWSCDGLTGSEPNPLGSYYVTSFGCWVDESGDWHSDSGDNCIPACKGEPGYDDVCPGMTGPACERHVNWYTADSDRFGCFSRLKVTNPGNGKAAVLLVLDRGPNCSIENNVDYWVLDMSYPASN